ncbi:MAG: glycosyltransferase family 2 protein [Planctomycetota bacterium]|jgi:GT2 family glycosyltransferase
MSKNSPLVSIIILGYNKGSITRLCLSSFLKLSYPNLEFWLIDNGSSDDTPDIFKEFKKNSPSGWSVNIKTNSENIGAVAGRNYALERFTGEFLLLLDNDVIVPENDWLGKIIARMSADKLTGALCPKLVFPKPENTIQCAGCKVSKTGRVSFTGRGEDERSSRYNKEYFCQCAISACLMIKGDIARKVGLLDTVFHPVQFEDIDFCYRIREKGLKILYYPEVSMLHCENITTDGSSDINYKYVTVKNGKKFKEKWRHVFELEDGPEDSEIKWLDIPKHSMSELIEVLDRESVTENYTETDIIKTNPEINDSAGITKCRKKSFDFPFDSIYLRTTVYLLLISISTLVINYKTILSGSTWKNVRKVLLNDFAEKTKLPIPGASLTAEGGKSAKLNTSLNEITLRQSAAEKNTIRESTPPDNKNTLSADAATPHIRESFIAKANIIVYLKSKVVLVRSHAEIAYIFRDVKTCTKTYSNQDQHLHPIGKYRIHAKSNTLADGPVLLLSYPEIKDINKAHKLGLINDITHRSLIDSAKNNNLPSATTPLGGNIKFLSKRHIKDNQQCSFGLNDEEIVKMYKAIPAGTLVWIVEK